ncbi:MAG: ComEC/Rec2 family competence protein [Paludibacter sp.]|nr:ComEC/Rec2 family competence protein [Paludibacter sp.]
MNFLQRTPFFRLLLPFIIGIILYQFVELFQWSLYIIYGLSCLFVAVSLLIRVPKRQYQFRWLFGLGIFLFMMALAYSLSSLHEKSDVFDHLHQKGVYRVELTSAPIEKAKSYLCKVKVLQFFDTSWKPAHGEAILYFQKDKATSKLLFGDRLMIEAEFTPPEKALNPDGFDYAAYLKRQGVGATCYISSGSWQMMDRNIGFSIRRESDKWRNYLLGVYRKFNIQGDEFAVLAALTLGYTDDLQPDLRASYSATGAMHILSVSGMHVGVVYIVMAFLLGFLNKSQRQKVFKALFIMLFLWAYAFLSGLSAAVIRATLMFTFVALATCFERKSQIYNTIFMSMLAMLLYNPNFLYDVGFQLSYAAVLSIIFFQPIVDKLYNPTNKFTKFVWEMFSVSIAAQLGTTPFTLYYFQQFPNYFLITNFIAIPLSSLVIYVAIGLLLVSFIPYLSVTVAFLLKWSLWMLNYFIVRVQNLPYSVWHISLDIKQTIVIFLAIFCFSGYYFNKKFSTLFVGLVSLLVACIFNLQTNYQTLTSKRMIVYAGQKSTHVNFINRNRNYVYSTDSAEIERIAKAFWQNQKLEKPIYIQNTNWVSDGFVYYEGSKILILTRDFLKNKITSTPIELDYLIIGNRLKPKIEQLLECVHPKKIIVDKSVSKWYAQNIRQTCNEHKIEFYSIAEHGAYVLNIKD